MLLLALMVRVLLTPRAAMPIRRCEVVGCYIVKLNPVIARRRPRQLASGYG
jgi:hypothetical protein